MPEMKSVVPVSSRAFQVAIFTMLVIGAYAALSVWKMSNEEKAVRQAQETLTVIGEMVAQVRDLELSQKTYLLVPDPKEMISFEAAVDGTNARLKRFLRMTTDDDDQQRRGVELGQTFAQEIRLAREALKARSASLEEATRSLASINGNAARQQMQTLVDGMKVGAEQLLQTHERKARQTTLSAYAVLALGVLFSLSFFAYALFLTMKMERNTAASSLASPVFLDKSKAS